MEYKLIRARRKTVSISVDAEGNVLVRAPRWVSRGQIEDFLKEKEGWIRKWQAECAELSHKRKAFSVSPGVMLPLFGREYPVAAGKRAGFTGEAFTINPASPAKPQLIKVYREQTRRMVIERAAFFAPIIGVLPAGIRITSATTRFGSCSGKNALSFPWKLAMAKRELFDYVVVHELCHIREHNHSKRFWTLVGTVLPDYKAREKGLKDFAKALAAQDWTD